MLKKMRLSKSISSKKIILFIKLILSHNREAKDFKISREKRPANCFQTYLELEGLMAEIHKIPLRTSNFD